MKWPRISGNTYNNGIEVSNEMATMSNSDIDGLYKYYYSSNNNINRVVFMFMFMFMFMYIWESRPLAESNRFGKSAVGRKYSV